MISKQTVLICDGGLHARPATFFIQKANSYSCSIWIEKNDRKVNAKSLLGVLSMGIAKGMSVTLVADGQGEEDVVEDHVAHIVRNGTTYEAGETRKKGIRRKGQNDEVEGEEDAAQRPFQIVHGGG